MKQKITVLGSTGSIGKNTLDVVARHPDRYEVFALSAATQVDLMLEQCAQFKPRFAVMASAPHAQLLAEKIKQNGLPTSVLQAPGALEIIASHEEVDAVMAAIVGAAGLSPCLAAARAGKRLLLANKEALVVGGNVFMRAVREGGATLLVSGVDPGWGNDALAVTAASLCTRIDTITCQEIFDYSTYNQPEAVRVRCGFGGSMEETPLMLIPTIPTMVWGGNVRLIGRGLGIEIAKKNDNIIVVAPIDDTPAQRSGIRSISALVDIGNYVMLELGQPMHAFDMDTLESCQIIVRRAKDGEKITTLDSKEFTLTPQNLVICDGEKPVALAGVMGGLNSEIKPETTQLLFESAKFARDNIRKTARGLGQNTDASAHYEKGISEYTTELGMARALHLIQELGCGEVTATVPAALSPCFCTPLPMVWLLRVFSDGVEITLLTPPALAVVLVLLMLLVKFAVTLPPAWMTER